MVLDPSPPPLGARVAKFRLAKLKESENDALVSVYSDYFFQVTSDMEFFCLTPDIYKTGHLCTTGIVPAGKKNGKKKEKRDTRIRINSGSLRVARGGSGAKAPPLATPINCGSQTLV